MNLFDEITERYDEAINELKVQIDLPALATPLKPQQEYNRRKRMEKTGITPGKKVAMLKEMVRLLEVEKINVLKGIKYVAQRVEDMNIPKDTKKEILGEIGFYEHK